MPKRTLADTEVQEVQEVPIRGSKKSKVTMNIAPSAAQQKAYVSEMVQVTQADPKTAAKLLAKSNWNTSAAINAFFNNPSNTASNPTRKALDQIFDKHNKNAKESPNELDMDSTQGLLETLDVSVEDISCFYFFEFTKSPAMGLIPREGFVSGPFLEASCDTPAKISQYVSNQLLSARGTMEQYKAVYNHTFTLMIEERKKAIDLDQAEAFWSVLTDSNKGFPWVSKGGVDFLPLWMEFLTTKWQKAVNRDLWRQTLTFMIKAKEDDTLSFWTEESSWPSVIDDFVQWVKVEKRGEEAMEE